MMAFVAESAWACKFPEGGQEVKGWGPGLLTTQNISSKWIIMSSLALPSSPGKQNFHFLKFSVGES